MTEEKKNPLEGKARTVIIKLDANIVGADHEEEFEVEEGMSDEDITAYAEEVANEHFGIEWRFEEKGSSDD